MLHRGNIVNLAALVLLLQLALPVSGLGGQSPESAPGRTWAVVIGIAKYSKLPGGFQLQFPDQDARAFSSAIKAAGVPAQNVKTLIGSEATVDAIRSAIGSWLPRAASPNDTVYIFFSGHGYVERDFNESYLLAYDSDPQNIYSTAISAADIEYILDHRLKARHVLFLQDAERRDFFGNDETGRADSSTFASSFSHLASSRPGISLITASSPGEFSWEGKRWGDQGAFTKYLIDGLSGRADKNKDGVVTDSELFAYLTEQLPRDTSNKQHPWRAGASQLSIAMTGGVPGSTLGTGASSTSATASSPSAVSSTAASPGSRTAVGRTSSAEPVTSSRPQDQSRESAGPGRTAADRAVTTQPESNGRRASETGAGAAASAPVNPRTEPSEPIDVSRSPEPGRGSSTTTGPAEKTSASTPARVPAGPPAIPSVSGGQPAPSESSASGSVSAPGSGPAPSPLIHDLETAIANGRLVEPNGYSAWDIYQKLNRMQPYPAEMADLRTSLAGALLKQSQDILSGDATLDLVSLHMDDFKRAGRMLGALRELDSGRTDAAMLQKLAAVDALIALQFYDEAEQSLGPLKESSNAAVQNAFGLLYKGQYDDWRAERSFKRAIELDANWATPHYNLGLLYEAQSKPEALGEFEQAVALSSSNARFLEALGDEYFHHQQWDKAADTYRKAILANPGFDVLHTKLGHALFSQGLRDEADKEYKRALELSGKH